MTKVLFLMWLADIAGSISTIGSICAVGLALGVIAAAFHTSTSYDCTDKVGDFVRITKAMRWLLLPVVIASIAPSASTIRLAAAAAAVDVAASSALGTKAVETLDAVLSKIKNEASK